MSKTGATSPGLRGQSRRRGVDVPVRDEILREYMHRRNGTAVMAVYSPQEYKGDVLAVAGYEQEGARRGGHIPGAKSIPWAKAANEDGTFKSADDLTALYTGQDITPGKK